MPKVTYIEHNGTAHEIELASGTSLMLGAVSNNVPGIDADCGGQCACATCHVYVDPMWIDKLDEAEESEKGMLSFSTNLAPNSRLSCQIEMSDELDGIVVRLPEGQH